MNLNNPPKEAEAELEPDPEKDLSSLLSPKLNPNLHSLLAPILPALTPFSRLPPSRLKSTALPSISAIELVSGPIFEEKYKSLYELSFHGGERERSDLIVERLEQDFAGARKGLAPYRIIGLRDQRGEAIGAAHFSVLSLDRKGDREEGGRAGAEAEAGERDGRVVVAPYLQYIYVREESRRRDMSELLHAVVLGVAVADAVASIRGGGAMTMVDVPFTFFETEPPGHTLLAGDRTRIHARGGSVAMMLRECGGERRVRSAHVQPGLEVGEPPITLAWVLRPNPASGKGVDESLVRRYGHVVIGAYYQSLRDEGFPEENIALSEKIVAKRVEQCEFVLMPLADITETMYKNID